MRLSLIRPALLLLLLPLLPLLVLVLRVLLMLLLLPLVVVVLLLELLGLFLPLKLPWWRKKPAELNYILKYGENGV